MRRRSPGIFAAKVQASLQAAAPDGKYNSDEQKRLTKSGSAHSTAYSRRILSQTGCWHLRYNGGDEEAMGFSCIPFSDREANAPWHHISCRLCGLHLGTARPFGGLLAVRPYRLPMLFEKPRRVPEWYRLFLEFGTWRRGRGGWGVQAPLPLGGLDG